MNNKNIPSGYELPSKRQLAKSTVLAICLAAVILVTTVLPAEYGLDPTGIGQKIGLLKMGEIKVSLAREAALADGTKVDPETTVPAQPEAETSLKAVDAEAGVDSRADKITIVLAPDEGKEVKLLMSKGSTVDYSWYTDGGEANYDAHADSKELNIKYHNYSKGRLEKSQGAMEAAFDGNHGWFWRNRTSKTMTVTLEVNGSYAEILQF